MAIVGVRTAAVGTRRPEGRGVDPVVQQADRDATSGGRISATPTLEFAEFLRIHLPALLRYGTALTGNPHDGADLVQVACEKAGAVWPRIAAADHPLAYIKTIMANARVSSWRRRRREHLVAELPEAGRSDRYPFESSPVWAAVAVLPKRQRAVVVLRYVEGHSESEIAALLGIAPGTVKSQASKAMATLRRMVSEASGTGL